MSTTQIIGATEAAKLLGLSRSGFNRRVNTGRIKPLGELGNRAAYVFDRAAIEAIAQQEKESANG